MHRSIYEELLKNELSLTLNNIKYDCFFFYINFMIVTFKRLNFTTFLTTVYEIFCPKVYK